MKTSRSQYIPEIDGLRALAVMVIIFFHLNRSVEYGYIGVDLFFVISGFVVTRSICTIENAGWSDISGFYVRRIKRIFPALFLTVIFGSLVSLYTVNAIQLMDVQKVGVFGLFGLANWRLFWSAQDYFGHAVEYNPFTHLWSLGVEEQFYLLVAPIVLLFFNRRFMIIGIISLVSLIVFLTLNSELYFYATSHRLWELGTGVLVALHYQNINLNKSGNYLAIVGVILILQAAFIGYLPEILTILGTCACIISFRDRNRITHRVFNNTAAIFVGKLSYSLYLWHWPIFVFFRMTYGLEQIAFQLLALLLTFVFAGLSYYWVEKPLRYRSWGGNTVQWQAVSALSVAIVLSILLTRLSNELPRISLKITGDGATPVMLAGEPSVNDWGNLGKSCRRDYEGLSETELFEKCLRRISDRPTIFLTGDSHATQLKFAFEKITGVTQHATFDFRYAVNNHLKEVTRKGIVNNELQYILTQVKTDDIVFIAIARGKFYDDEWSPKALSSDPMDDPLVLERVNHYASALTRFAQSLEQKGATLVLVESGPKLIIPASAKICFARLKLTSVDICNATAQSSLHERKPLSVAISDVVKSTSNTFTFDFHEAACPNGLCNIFHGKELFMVDGNHISKHFSENYVAPLLQILFRKMNKNLGDV